MANLMKRTSLCRFERSNDSRGWRVIGGKKIYCRSRWEANFARALEYQKGVNLIDWFYEPETFWFMEIKRGVRSYKPDFKILDYYGDHYWVEVKGYYDSKSLTKIKRFRKYYPNEKLIVVDKKWFNNNTHLSRVIEGWE